MSEILSAQLQLDLSLFSSALTRAGQEIAAFATRAQQQIQAATASLSGNTQASQQNTQATQQNATANNALLLAMQNLQSTSRQQLTTLGQISTQLGQTTTAFQQATTAQAGMGQGAGAAAGQFQAAWSTALGVLSGIGIATSFRAIAASIKGFVDDTISALRHLATEAVTGFADFERGMLKIASLMPGVTKHSAEFAEFGRAIHDLAISTGIDTKNIQAAFFDVQSTLGSGKTQEAFEILRVGADLAVAGFTDVKTATTVLTAVINQFGLAASDATKVANALNVASLQNRVDFESFARTLPPLLPLLTLWKVSIESAGVALAVTTGHGLEAGKSVTGMSQALLSIGAPTARAQKYLEELAKQLGVAKIEIKTFADGSADLLSTFAQFEGIQPDLLRRIMGSNQEALKFIISLTTNMGEFRTKLLEAVNAQDDLVRQSALAHSGIQQQWNQSRQAIQTFYDVLGAVLGQHPAVMALIDQLRQAFIALTKYVDEHRESLMRLIENLSAVGEIGIKVFSTLAQWAINFGSALGNVAREMKNVMNAMSIGGGILEGLDARDRARALATVNPAQYGAPIGPPLDPYEAYNVELARRGIGAATGGGATVPQGAPRTGLGLADIQSGIDAEKAAAKAGKAAEAEAKRVAAERVKITQDMEVAIAGVEEGAFARKKLDLAQYVADARKASVDTVLIAQYERDQLIKFTMEVTDKQTVEFAKRVAGATAAMKEEDAAIDQQRRAFNELQRLAEADDPIEKQRIAGLQRVEEARLTLQRSSIITSTQLETALEDGRTAVNQRALDERQKQEQAAAKKALEPWKQLATQLTQTLSSAFEQILSGTFDLWDTVKRAFIKLIADLAAIAVTQKIIIPLLMQVSGAGGLVGGNTAGGSLGGLASLVGLAGGAAGTSGTGDGNGGVGDSFATGLNVVSTGNSLSSNLGGPTLLGTTGGGLFSSLASTELGEFGISGPGYIGGEAGSLGGLSGTTLGELAAGISAYATPVVVGIAVGQILAMANAQMGLHGAGSSALAGAGGGAAAGAIAGSAVFPGIGTAVGALIGTAVGALGGGLMGLNYKDKQNAAGAYNDLSTLGLSELVPGGRSGVGAGLLSGFLTGGFGSLLFQGLFGGRPEPGFAIKGVQPGQAAYNETQGLTLQTPFAITEDFHQRLGVNYEELKTNLNAGINEVATNLLDAFKGLNPTLQQGLVEPLNRVFLDIANKIIVNGEMDSDKLGESISTFFGTTIPGYFTEAGNTVIKQLQAAGKKLDPVLTKFTDIIDTIHRDIDEVHVAIGRQMDQIFAAVEQSMEQLRQQQVQLNATFQGASDAIMTALYSPAQSFLFAQQQYAGLKQQFASSTQEQQLGLAPHLAQAASQLLNMAKSGDVLGQDPETVRALQATLLQDLSGFQGSTELAFSDIHNALVGFRQGALDTLSSFRATQEAALQQQADTASAQVALLQGSLGSPDTIDATIASSLDVLHQIQAALPGIMGGTTADAQAQAQVVLLGSLTTLGASQLQVLQEISAKLGAGVPHFAGGSDTLPRPTFAMLHAGERVLSAAQNMGGGTTTVEHVIRTEGDTPTGRDLAHQVASEVVSIIERRGGRLGTTSIVVKR